MKKKWNIIVVVADNNFTTKSSNDNIIPILTFLDTQQYKTEDKTSKKYIILSIVVSL